MKKATHIFGLLLLSLILSACGETADDGCRNALTSGACLSASEEEALQTSQATLGCDAVPDKTTVSKNESVAIEVTPFGGTPTYALFGIYELEGPRTIYKQYEKSTADHIMIRDSVGNVAYCAFQIFVQ